MRGSISRYMKIFTQKCKDRFGPLATWAMFGVLAVLSLIWIGFVMVGGYVIADFYGLLTVSTLLIVPVLTVFGILTWAAVLLIIHGILDWLIRS